MDRWQINQIKTNLFGKNGLVSSEFKKIYGIKESKTKNMILAFNLKFLKITRPFLPPFFRLIAPARWAQQRLSKFPDLKFQDKAKY